MRRKRRRPAQKFNRKMRTKLMVLFSLILAVLCGLVGRLTYIEHTKGETYQKKVLSMQSYDSKTIPYQTVPLSMTKKSMLIRPWKHW